MKTNMQIIKKRSPKHRKLVIALLCIALLFAGALVFAYFKDLGPFKNTPPTETVDYNEPSDDQVKEGQDVKQQTIESETKPTDSSSGTDTSATSSATGSVAVEITNEPRNDNGVLNVKTLIQEVNSSGTCTLTLSKSGQQSVVKTAKVQALPNSSTCQGFAVDVSKLTSGAWNLKIEYKSNKSNGSVSQTVQL